MAYSEVSWDRDDMSSGMVPSILLAVTLLQECKDGEGVRRVQEGEEVGET